MSIRRWIRNWLNGESVKLSRTENSIETANESGAQIAINSAINGRVLSIRTYQPNRKNTPQVHSDWVTEMYVIKEGESLTEALTMLLMMKGIDK